MQLIFTEQTGRVGSPARSLALLHSEATSLVPLSPGGQCVPGVQQGKEVIGWRQAGHFSISLSSVALSFSSPPLLRAGLR